MVRAEHLHRRIFRVNLSDPCGQAWTKDIAGEVRFVDDAQDCSHRAVAVFRRNLLGKVHGRRYDQKRNALVPSPDEDASTDGEMAFRTTTDRLLHCRLNSWAEEPGVFGVDPSVHEAVRVGRGNDCVARDSQNVAACTRHLWRKREGSMEFLDQVWVCIYEMKSHVACPPNALAFTRERPSAADRRVQRHVRQRFAFPPILAYPSMLMDASLLDLLEAFLHPREKDVEGTFGDNLVELGSVILQHALLVGDEVIDQP
jgi:hypothetical protein